jgi:preprotein translocase subunit SecE
MIGKIKNYVSDSVEEMKKVTWPTRKETYNYTLLVIGISVGMAAFLGLLDYVFAKAIELIITR